MYKVDKDNGDVCIVVTQTELLWLRFAVVLAVDPLHVSPETHNQFGYFYDILSGKDAE